jgi:hypothetical protein
VVVRARPTLGSCSSLRVADVQQAPSAQEDFVLVFQDLFALSSLRAALRGRRSRLGHAMSQHVPLRHANIHPPRNPAERALVTSKPCSRAVQPLARRLLSGRLKMQIYRSRALCGTTRLY